jgi:hypothetical protein
VSFVNYADLKAAVSAWAARGDSTVTDRVDDFIRLGEQRIWETGEHVVRNDLWGLSGPTTLAVGAGTNYASLPADFLGFARVRSATEPRIEYMSPDALEDLPSPGRANVYSIEGGRLVYGQTVGLSTPLTVRYYQHPGFLVTVGTTWLYQRAPSVYLYAALIEQALFVKNSAKVAEWGTLLEKAINGLESASRAALAGGGRLRVPGRF